MMELPKGDIVWFLVACSAAIVFSELQAREQPSTRLLAVTIAWVTVVAALLWVVLGQA